MKNKKTNHIHIYSDTLKMKITYNPETGNVKTEDGLIYTKEEINALSGGEITSEIHMLKKIFNGKVVKDEN